MGSALGLLAQLDNPADLRRLPPSRLPALAAEIRQFLVDKVSRTGGHLGPNLGVVELTIAVHRVFNSPKDRIIFDTGHQAYVHKLLTGRRAGFDQLRQRGGLAGYPMRAESEHDLVENSHASTALSYADGLAKAYALSGQRRRVVAVVGDGALTGGMSWEALNNVASARDRQVIVVVNDNGRSYSPTIGGLAEHLSALRLSREYEQVLALVKDALSRTPLVGSATFEVLHGVKRGLKDVLAPQGLFEDLGLKYVGPVNGHDIAAVESALRQAKAFGGPVLVHCVTRKGHGYRPAEEDEADCLHGPGAFDPATGKPLAAPRATWTSVFSEELVRIGRRRPDVVAITAAMLRPTGLAPFAAAFPERVFDVGIAEQHGVTSAAGLAMGGLHPVVAVYSTFMNRAFDQVLMDVALHRLPVTFVLDRSGITGDDGPSHHGMWDLALFGIVPGLRIAAPRDGATLRALLGEAVADATGPTMVRFPKGSVPAKVPAHESTGGVDVLRRDERSEVLLVSVGAMAQLCLDAAARVAAEGIAVTVVDPRWVQPVPEALLELARGHRFVVTVEDGVRTGGFGSRLSQALRDAECDVALREIGLSSAFLAHGTREQVLAEQGISAQSVARQVVEWVSRLQEASELRASGMEPELA